MHTLSFQHLNKNVKNGKLPKTHLGSFPFIDYRAMIFLGWSKVKRISVPLKNIIIDEFPIK